MDTIEPQEGDFFEGVLLETCRDGRVTRPRVRPVEMLPQWLRVEFPRHLREDNPIRTRFRADVHVRRKHHADGRPNGDVYLRAENNSILRIEEPDDEQVVMARQKAGSISGRSYEYILIRRAPKTAAKVFSDLRRRAYESIIEHVPSSRAEAIRRERSKVIAAYVLLRSSGNCEGCKKPAPFLRRNDQPYLEIHHIIGLADGGSDHPSNVAAVCPNCHTRVRHGKDGDVFNATIKLHVHGLENELDGST
jgi:5-methylcytosine-specific restriction endonuclease McrA